LRLAAAATRSPGRSPAVARLPLLLWPLGAAAVAAGFYFLFDSGGDVTAVQVINRSVGGSFIACGLVAWQRRPENRTGLLMTLTGFLFLAEPLLIEVDSSGAYTLGQVVALWWAIPFTALILAFPSGRITSPIDAIIVSAFFVLEVIVQFIWVLFLPFPEGKTNVLQVRADADLAHTIDTWQRWCVVAVGMALVVVGVTRWLRAPAPLRRLLLPTLAGSIAVFVLIGLTAQRLLDDQSASRPTQTIAGIVMVLVPLAFVFGLLRAQLARAGMADLVVALQRTPESGQLGDVLAQALRDPSLVLAYWLPRFGAYVDGDGQAVALPAEGSGRAATCIDHDGEHVAVLVHVAALAYEPELLEIVCAAADIALEQERLQAELKARADELVGSRARIVEAGDTARRRLERDLHDGAQQRLLSLGLALHLARQQLAPDANGASDILAEADGELRAALEELRELAHGIHPAVLTEQGLAPALKNLAERSPVPVTIVDLPDERLPAPAEAAAYFLVSEALANVAKYAQASRARVSVSRVDGLVLVEVDDDGVGGADPSRGSGLRGLSDRVQALDGKLEVTSPAGSGTHLHAEIPCA
jgi:signal transduction histidine kinase